MILSESNSLIEFEQINKPIIVGAGPSGTAASLFLAKNNIPSLLIDQADFPRDKICGDALSGKVIDSVKKLDHNFAKELNVFSHGLPSWGVQFIAPSGKSLKIPFKQNYDSNSPSPGLISKRIDFDYWWFKKALNQPLIEVKTGYKLIGVEKKTKGLGLTFSDNFSDNNGKDNILRLISPITIAADGAQSLIAKRIHNFRLEQSHYCAGIRSYYSNVDGLLEDGFIELHFIRELLPGYLWIFPLPDKKANVGLGIRSDFVARKKINLRKVLLELLDNHPELKLRFQNSKRESDIVGWGLPLGSKKRAISGDHYLLCGDAASLIDPFTGEGIGNGMISGRIAAEFISNNFHKSDFKTGTTQEYDKKIYNRLWNELSLSSWLQKLVQYPSLFNFVVQKASGNSAIQETISCMFEDVNLRKKFTNPGFYWKLFFNK